MADRISEVKSDLSIFDAETITNLYLYGTVDTPENLFDRVKTNAYFDTLRVVNTDDGDLRTVTLNIDGKAYLDFGAGKDVTPANFNIVRDFFTSPGIPAGEYGFSDIVSRLSSFFSPDYSTSHTINYLYYDGAENDIERTYIFGNSSFKLGEEGDLVFVVTESGDKYIENIHLKPFNDNFDLTGGSLSSDAFNFIVGGISIDPFGVGTRIEIVYDNAEVELTSTYTEEDYAADALIASDNTTSVPNLSGLTGTQDKFESASEYEIDGYSVILGGPDVDDVSESDAVGLTFFDVPMLALLGEGDDTATGGSESDRLYGHSGNDELNGGAGIDHLFGGSGNDEVFGGSGNDFLFGDGSDENYRGSEETLAVLSPGNDILAGGAGLDVMTGGAGQDIFFGTPDDLNGDTITDLEVGDFIQLEGVATSDIIDNFTYYGIGSNITLSFNDSFTGFFDTTVSINMDIPDGATLKLVEDSAEAKIEVVGRGQDIAFVVDTTGSMSDDIANVKASATEIINSVFDPERGLTDSRIAVVGFNDPTTETVLSFTDHADPEDRKDAALNAINSLSANGGGDFPELTYTGLLRALDGRAGEWRDDAVARKIILFGDATAKDTHLRDQVIALANDLGADIEASVSASAFSTVDVSEDIALTSFALSAEAEGEETVSVPVQIFTVAIGSNTDTAAEYESISEATGGDDFSAAGAADIVETLLEVINLPIYTIFASSRTITEGDEGVATIEVTVQRDAADNAADVAITLSGTGDTDDGSLETTTVSFAEGELEKTVELSVSGDTILEDNETLTVTIDSVSETSTIGTPSTTVTILNDDASDGDDVINGDNSGNVLDGGAGNDQVIGNGGDDNISGGTGNDILGGGTGNDEIVDGIGSNTLDGGSGLDKLITLSGLNSQSGGEGSDLLVGGIQADALNGGAGNDVIRGEASNGFLGGSDTITGGNGDDIMMGGRGADVFVFNTNDGNDVIGQFGLGDVAFDNVNGYSVTANGADFQTGVDHIQLTGFSTVDASNVMSSVTDGADGAVFSAEGTDITFYGVAANQLTADDFIFV